MSGRGLIDTSTVILLGRVAEPSSLPDEPCISTVTLAELTVGPLVAKSADERATRQRHLQQAEADFQALDFDTAAARTFGAVALSLRQQGRKVSARAFDAMIAAVAMSAEIPLYTCNPADFLGIDGLDLRPVPHPDGG